MNVQYKEYKFPGQPGFPRLDGVQYRHELNTDIQLADYIAENGGVKASYNAYSEYPQETQ